MSNTNKHFQVQVQVKGVTLTYSKGDKPTVAKTQTVQPTPAPPIPSKPTDYGTIFVGIYIFLAFVALIGYVWWKKQKKTKSGLDFMAIVAPIILIGIVCSWFKKKR